MQQHAKKSIDKLRFARTPKGAEAERDVLAMSVTATHPDRRFRTLDEARRLVDHHVLEIELHHDVSGKRRYTYAFGRGLSKVRTRKAVLERLCAATIPDAEEEEEEDEDDDEEDEEPQHSSGSDEEDEDDEHEHEDDDDAFEEHARRLKMQARLVRITSEFSVTAATLAELEAAAGERHVLVATKRLADEASLYLIKRPGKPLHWRLPLAANESVADSDWFDAPGAARRLALDAVQLKRAAKALVRSVDEDGACAPVPL